jgi:phosphatidate cytidylyltransferase
MPDAVGSTPLLVAAPSKLKIFLRRLISFVVLWTVVLTALFSGNRLISDYVFLVIMVVLAAAGLAEFYGLAAKRELVCFERWGIFGGVLLMVVTFFNLTGQLGTSGSPARVNDFETSFLILFVLGLCLRQFVSRSNTAGMVAISTTLFGLMYVPWLLNFIQKINFFPHVEGHYYLLYFLLITSSAIPAPMQPAH